jgi:hypothetical protein
MTIQDDTAPVLDLESLIILEKFDADDTTILKSGIYFTEDGLEPGSTGGGVEEYVRAYGSLASIAIDFETTSKIYKAASLIFSQEIVPTYVYVGRLKTDDTITNSLNLIAAEDNSFYGIKYTGIIEQDILDIAAWAEANTKQFLAMSNDADIIGSGTADIVSLLKALDYNRTGFLYHNVEDSAEDLEQADAAIFAKGLCYQPGTDSFKFINVAGVTADNDSTLTAAEKITDAQVVNARAKNCNLYLKIRGNNIFGEGYAVSGRFFDLTKYGDYLKNTIENEVFLSLINPQDGNKVPYTDSGLKILKGVIQRVLQSEIDKGTLTWYEKTKPNGKKVSVPYEIFSIPVADVPVNTKRLRQYPNLGFKCQYSSAIHGLIPISGKLMG